MSLFLLVVIRKEVEKMLGIYFSGTGNTRYCTEKFLEYYDGSKPISIESPDVVNAIRDAKEILLGYPIYYSNIPKILRDFINENCKEFKNKKVFIISTMGLFSGDGAGCSARLLKEHGATIIGGLHLKMPDCIGDEKVLKKPLEKNKQIVLNAEKKIKDTIDILKDGKPSKDGLSIFHQIAGLFGQRLWFYKKTQEYSDKLKIDNDLCIACAKCVQICPMKNITISNEIVTGIDKCTLCYRCFSNCPQKAITILGSKVYEQCLIENYIDKN
jgi:ferredoxin